MSNEIKQGDKVRVSKDAPKIYLMGWYGFTCDVIDIEDSYAKIKCNGCVLVIPTKHLVKVDAEAKEGKFKVGDIVTHKNSPHIWRCVTAIMSDGTYVLDGEIYDVEEPDLVLYTEPSAPEIKAGDRVRNIESGLIGVVDKIVYGNVVWVNGVDGKRYHWKSDGLELIQPTEQTHQRATIISEGDIHSLDETPTNKIGSIKIPVELDLTDSYWAAYAADLAKEVVLKVANKYNDPEEAAEYAVKVAKAVAEGLKGK